MVGRALEVIANAFTSPGEVGRAPDRWGFALTHSFGGHCGCPIGKRWKDWPE